MAAPAALLVDDLIGEILLRLPPDDPASLFRAALVCKPWRALLTDRAFLRRYRAFHRTPPALGFLHDVHRGGGRVIPRFFPITEASPPPIPQPEPRCWTLDCRHGRVLLHSSATSDLIVWDPIAGGRQEIPQPVNQHEDYYEYFTAAVLCASDGCDDHHECRRGPFVVVFAGADIDDAYGDDEDGVTWATVYSSSTGAWSAEVSIHLGPILENREVIGRSLLAGDALYFTVEEGRRILKYDLSQHALSVIKPPPLHIGNMVLVTAEDGGLGAAGVKGYSLHLWSWRIGADSVGKWVPGRVVELDMMISIGIGDPTTKLNAVGFAEGADSIFINANDVIFTVEMKSGSVKKIGKRGDFSTVFPYMSFYTPDHAST
ncbi:unnamed protein product [Urochloa decumbens]|uniref:F-box domain-containing protein n=1 Tax=Urochloa decumbens TaxID=240449 RepID=A0ABC9D9K4_9POAL